MTRLSRRKFIALGAVAAAGLMGLSRAQDRVALRLSLVLPARTNRTLLQARNHGVAAEAALRGALLGGEDPAFSSLLGGDLEVLLASAPDAEAAGRVAHRLCALEEVAALIGGHGPEQSTVLSGVAAQRGVPFFNLSQAGGLQDALTFHMEPTRKRYLTAVGAWHANQGHTSWLAVHAGTEGEQLAAALLSTGAARVETTAVEAGGADFSTALTAGRLQNPEVVLLDLPWLQQLDLLEQFENEGLDAALTVIPDAVSQTREFLATARERAPRQSSATVRPAVWDASIDHELNDRFEARWGVPMDPPAWTAWQAVRMLTEAVAATGSQDGAVLSTQLAGARFDVGKSVPVGFARQSQQLSQPLYVVRVRPQETRARALAEVVAELH